MYVLWIPIVEQEAVYLEVNFKVDQVILKQKFANWVSMYDRVHKASECLKSWVWVPVWWGVCINSWYKFSWSHFSHFLLTAGRIFSVYSRISPLSIWFSGQVEQISLLSSFEQHQTQAHTIKSTESFGQTFSQSCLPIELGLWGHLITIYILIPEILFSDFFFFSQGQYKSLYSTFVLTLHGSEMNIWVYFPFTPFVDN